mmetsp:Transcript_36582/g.114960  ORF Transcript_36582/g.114960 Transcript_36582/m.114960 type:complete len:312 (-) Transcript_36582:777-1712(-)
MGADDYLHRDCRPGGKPTGVPRKPVHKALPTPTASVKSVALRCDQEKTASVILAPRNELPSTWACRKSAFGSKAPEKSTPRALASTSRAPGRKASWKDELEMVMRVRLAGPFMLIPLREVDRSSAPCMRTSTKRAPARSARSMRAPCSPVSSIATACSSVPTHELLGSSLSVTCASRKSAPSKMARAPSWMCLMVTRRMSARLKSASVKTAAVKSASRSSAPVRLAPCRFARAKMTFASRAPRRLAPAKLVSYMVLPRRSAPSRLAPRMSTPSKVEESRLWLRRSTRRMCRATPAAVVPVQGTKLEPSPCA